MKKVGWAIGITALIFFISVLIVGTIISNGGYSASESSYHLMTQVLLFSLIVTVITCTMILIDEINKIKIKLSDNKNNH